MSIEQKVRPVVLEPGQTVTAFGPQDYAEEDPDRIKGSEVDIFVPEGQQYPNGYQRFEPLRDPVTGAWGHICVKLER